MKTELKLFAEKPERHFLGRGLAPCEVLGYQNEQILPHSK